MANTTKKDGFLFPKITDLKSAQKAGRQGSIAEFGRSDDRRSNSQKFQFVNL